MYLDGSDSYDPDNDDISYSWEFQDDSPGGIIGIISGINITLNSKTTARPYFTAPTLSDTETSKSLTFELSVTDEAGLVDTDTVIVTITKGSSSNTLQAVATASASSVEPGDEVTLDGRSSDGTIDFYEWTQVSGTDVTILDADEARATFVAPSNVGKSQENLVFELTVSDDDGYSDSDRVTVVLLAEGGSPTDPPVDPPADGLKADAGTYGVVYSGQLVTLDGSGSADPDGEITAYSWYQLGPGGSFLVPEEIAVQLSGTRTVNATFIAPDVEEETTLMFQLFVGNADGDTDTDECSITVMPAETVRLYFPHVGSDGTWETELGLINKSSENALTGQLIAYDDDGVAVGDMVSVALPALGRKELIVGDTFTTPENIGYIVFETNMHDAAEGYTRMSIGTNGALAFAAVPETDVSSGLLYVPHMAAEAAGWSTILAFLNTGAEEKTLQLSFNTGDQKSITLAAGEHKAVSVDDLFSGDVPPNLKAAEITGAAGVIGVEIFKESNLMAGALLVDELATRIVFPHVPNDEDWVAGIVAYNMSSYTEVVTLIPYSAEGAVLAPKAVAIAPWDTMVSLTSTLGISSDAAWIDMLSTSDVAGLSLFANLKYANYAGMETTNIIGNTGIFPRAGHAGFDVGLVLINTEYEAATVTIKAYDNDGELIAEIEKTLAGHAKLLNTSATLFGDTDVSGATYFTFSSDKVLCGLQVTLSSDQQMGDAIPAL